MGARPLVFDLRTARETRTRSRERWLRVRIAERQFAKQLRGVAREVDRIVKRMAPKGVVEAPAKLVETLRRYRDLVRPWSQAVAERMLADVALRDENAWNDLASSIGQDVRQALRTAPIKGTLQALAEEQVELITSLPEDAAMRVHRLSVEALSSGARAAEVSADIMRTGLVTKSRANLIARTEVGRASTHVTRVRAEHIGSVGYIWRTARDSDVRPSHRKLEGKVIAWDEPPVAGENGERAHAGAIFNCFPGSTPISLANGCHYLFRRWYEGPLVLIEHESGRFELTPNHPVLTRRGWIAAQNLQRGDHLVKSRSDAFCAIEDNKNEGQPTFDDLFATLDVVTRRKVQEPFLFDFHGERPRHDVDAIRADHLLPGCGMPTAFERFCNLALSRADARVRDSIDCSTSQIGESRSSSCADNPSPAFRANALHAPDVRLRCSSPFDSVSIKDFEDCPSVAMKSYGQSQLARSTSIGFNDEIFIKIRASLLRRNAMKDLDPPSTEMLAQNIGMNIEHFANRNQRDIGRYEISSLVNKEFRSFSGHVFTMQTSTGWFTITSCGVIVKNCRCYCEPILPDEV